MTPEDEEHLRDLRGFWRAYAETALELGLSLVWVSPLRRRKTWRPLVRDCEETLLMFVLHRRGHYTREQLLAWIAYKKQGGF